MNTDTDTNTFIWNHTNNNINTDTDTNPKILYRYGYLKIPIAIPIPIPEVFWHWWNSTFTLKTVVLRYSAKIKVRDIGLSVFSEVYRRYLALCLTSLVSACVRAFLFSFV